MVSIPFSKHICPTPFCRLPCARELLNQRPRAVPTLSSRVGRAGGLRTPSCTPQAGPRRAEGAQRAPAPGGPFRPESRRARGSSRSPGALLSSRRQGAPETAGGPPRPRRRGGCAVTFNRKPAGEQALPLPSAPNPQDSRNFWVSSPASPLSGLPPLHPLSLVFLCSPHRGWFPRNLHVESSPQIPGVGVTASPPKPPRLLASGRLGGSFGLCLQDPDLRERKGRWRGVCLWGEDRSCWNGLLYFTVPRVPPRLSEDLTLPGLGPKTGGRERTRGAFWRQSGEGSFCEKARGRVSGFGGHLNPLREWGRGRCGLSGHGTLVEKATLSLPPRKAKALRNRGSQTWPGRAGAQRLSLGGFCGKSFVRDLEAASLSPLGYFERRFKTPRSRARADISESRQ